jgi:hypothetical protein
VNSTRVGLEIALRTYTRKAGVRLPPRTSWDEQRAAITGTLPDPGTTTTVLEDKS